MGLCRMLHSENGQHNRNDDKVRGMVRRALCHQGGIIGVIGEGDNLKGCILLLIDPVWYSDEYQLLELFNFVHPDHRKSAYAKELIEFGKKCADELHIDLMIGVLSNIRMEAKVRLYGRLLEKGGEFFIHRSRSADTAECAA